MITIFERILSSISDLFTIIASSLAIYLYLFKKEPILSAIRLLLNYSTYLTLTDLTSKIDRLNDHHGDDPSHKSEILNILHEIEGQINGNRSLKVEFEEFLKKTNEFTIGKKSITEPIKRSLVHELRERLRDSTLENAGYLINKNK